ncbi:hypothetical protein SMMN14_04435 [Sphaerulina musiva]
MQFKLFTAAIAAMAVGGAVASPVPDVEARDLRLELDTQHKQFNDRLNDVRKSQQAQGWSVPNSSQITRIKQQVQGAHRWSSNQRSQFWPYTYYNNYYDSDLYNSYRSYYILYSNLYNNCYYGQDYCNNYYKW